MATIKQIRQRIKTAKSIQQITRAMKLVASARLRKAQEKALDARPYSQYMRELMSSLLSSVHLNDHPLLRKSDKASKNYILILITAERGLAGAYNTNLIKKASEFLSTQEGNANLICIGKKGSQFFERRKYPILQNISLSRTGPVYKDAVDLAENLQRSYLSGEIDHVYVCYNKFLSAIRQIPQITKLLPIDNPDISSYQKNVVQEYIFEPNPTELLEILLPKYLQTEIFQTLLEANASEHGARMTAMTSATDNARKMIQDLTLKANRERQAAITKEILEVVGGAEALRG